MDEVDGLDRFEDQVAAMERALGGAEGAAAAFGGEVTRASQSMADAGRGVRALSGGITRGLRRSFDGLLLDGAKLSDALRGVGQAMLNTAYSAAVRPVTREVGGLLSRGVESLITGLLPFRDGAGFSQGRVMPFARGGVVSGAAAFPMRGGIGVMGEAGPEAILPLARGRDGRLGVRTEGGAPPVQLVMNITTPDAESFRRSQSQIAAQMGRALSRGQRNR